jgi:hypothetical protein
MTPRRRLSRTEIALSVALIAVVLPPTSYVIATRHAVKVEEKWAARMLEQQRRSNEETERRIAEWLRARGR